MHRPTRFFPVSVELAGVRWSGRCEHLGDRIEVCSAYGWASRPIGRRKPELLARELLLEILHARLAASEAGCAA